MMSDALNTLGITQQQLHQLTADDSFRIIAELMSVHGMTGAIWFRTDIIDTLDNEFDHCNLTDEEQAHVINEVLKSRAWADLFDDLEGPGSRVAWAVEAAIHKIAPEKCKDEETAA